MSNRRFLLRIVRYAVVAICFFLTGFSLRPFYERYTRSSSSSASLVRGTISRLDRPGFEFINPLLECEVADKTAILEFQPLNNLLQKQVQTEINGKKARKISIYYRGLTTGRWAGFDEGEIYPGGSLVKIPFLMAYYKAAEDHPEILDEMLTYAGDFDESVQQRIPPSKKIEAGKSYSIAELIYRMIVYSGNNSTVLLMRRIDRALLNTVFEDLDVPKNQDANRQWLVTTKTFSSFFRILYNATYLSRTMSERALKLLSLAEFKDGLVAGVPPKVKVAHKFGEFSEQLSDGTILSSTLHDCGIIYHAAHPYFLCVMTEGVSLSALEGVIARISKAVYGMVDSPLYPVPPKENATYLRPPPALRPA